MSLDKKITDFLDNQIPEYVQEYYPIFVIFVTKYYEWLEQGGNPQEIIQNIQLNADIDTTASSLATKFVNTYAPNLPQTSALNRSVLVKNFRDFYRSKGSLKSFEFFFRAFFDDDITVKLPGDSLFRTSGGDWYVEKTLRVRAVTGNPRNLEHVTVQGTSSFATAIIEHAVQNYGLWDLTVQNRSLSGTFSSSETITGTYWVHTATTSISSQIVVQNTAAVNVAAGTQRGTRSQLSSDQVIQDSIYWQRFSYVIKTRITLDRWKDAVLEQLHPSGRNLFGEILLDNDASVAVSAVATTFAQSNAISTEVRFATSDDFIIQPGYSFDRLANFKTGTSETTSAGIVSYTADFVYGGENITFALQNAADNIRSYVESFTFTSITGTVSAAATTGNTAINRDSVSYTMPVTSITGTISGISQPLGGEMVITGTGTYFNTEMPLGNIWRYYTGTVDAFNNPIYAYYSSVVTINDLAITGTITLPTQTPVAPNYYYYASGAGTAFLSDLLVTGGDTSSGVSNETDRPIIFPGQATPRIVINDVPFPANIVFTSGSTSIYDEYGQLNSLYVGGNIKVIKELSGRLVQVSSLPAISSSYLITRFETLDPTYNIVGSSLTTVSSVGSSRSQEPSLSQYTDPALWARYDLQVPFPIYFLDTSTTKIYVHSTGLVAFDTSIAAYGTTNTTGTVSSFQPAVPRIYVNPYWNNKLKNLYYQSFGVTPNRYFKIYYDGWYEYPSENDWVAYGVAAFGAGPNAIYGQNFNILTTGAGLTVSTTPTSGTVSNGYWQITLPWSFNFFTTSYNQLFISHHGRVSLGDWKDGSGYTITTNVTTSNGLFYSQPVLPRIEPMYISESQPDGPAYSPWTAVQVNARFGNRVYYGVSAGSALTTSRIFTVRWEGGFYSNSPDNRAQGWEISFNEAYLSSVTLHGAISPYQQQFSLASWNFVNVPLWKVGPDGVAYQESKQYLLAPYFSSSGTYANNVNSTSEQITFSTASSDITRYSGKRQQWEMTFYENSSTGITLNYAADTGATGGSWSDNPAFRSSKTYYTYFANRNGDLIAGYQTASIINYVVFNPALGYFESKESSYTQRYVQSLVPAVSAIVSTYNLSSSTSMLFRLGNVEAEQGTQGSVYTNNPMYWSALGTIVGATTALEVTSLGVISRWPRDGFRATVSIPNPNPTCVVFTSSIVTIPPGGYMASPDLSYGTSNTGLLYTSSTATVTRYGYLFSYGSSVTTHGRWFMATPTFGTLHACRINGYISGSYTNDLNSLTGGQNLELYYSLSENPVPPAPGETPTSAGWTKLTNIWFAGGAPAHPSGLLFDPVTNNTIDAWESKNFYKSSTPYTGDNGIYVYGKTMAESGAIAKSESIPKIDVPFKLTWLVYQVGYTAQTTSNARLSEYLITEFSTRAYPTGYLATSGFFSINTVRLRPWDPTILTLDQWLPYYSNYGNQSSGSTARLRDEIGSGSIVRITHPYINAAGTVTNINVDYVVASDPKIRGQQGDFTLVLQATTSIANTGYTNIYDSVTPGGYFKGAGPVNAYIVETRTISSITDQFNASVTQPWTSTSIKYWGNNTSSISTASRAFNIVTVNNNNSLTLVTATGNSSVSISLVNGLTATADRRFVLTGINTSSNMTVSGGGVYANFTGKTATFARYENSRTSGFLVSGYHDASLLTSNTLWLTNGIPGIDNLGINKGNVPGTRLVIGNSSYTVVSIVDDTTILVTGSAILRNFYDTGLTMYFPSYSSNISVTGISTLFLPQITTGTATSAGVTIEEVTETGRTPDFRYGFLQIGNTSFAITSIINDTSLIVVGGPITESFAATSAISYVYRRDYPLPRVIGAPDSASFDKAGSIIGVDDSLVTQGNDVDFTTFRTLYHSSSYTLTLTANTVVLSTSIAVNAASSLVLLLTWMKDFTFNSQEGNNRFTVSVSSAGTFRVLYDNEIQQNYKDVAVGQTLLYSNTFYVHSSNTISSTNVVNSGDTTSQVVWTWIPFNANRSGVYDRLSARFESRGDSSVNISVSVPAGYQWNSTTSDFVNITVLGAA